MTDLRADTTGGCFIAQAEVVRVHACADLVVPGTQHIDPARWNPLVYNFRHYLGLGAELGHTFRSQTAPDGGEAPLARRPDA